MRVFLMDLGDLKRYIISNLEIYRRKEINETVSAQA